MVGLRFGALGVVDFVSAVVSTAARAVLFIFFLNDSSSCEDIEASLSFSDDFSVLMFFKADVFLFASLLNGFAVFIH